MFDLNPTYHHVRMIWREGDVRSRIAIRATAARNAKSLPLRLPKSLRDRRAIKA